MQNVVDGSLLGRRLDRLRSDSGHPSGAPSGASDHARQLATALGGRVIASHAGDVVELRSRHHLPVALAGLQRLPYAVPNGQPLFCLDLETTGLATAAGTLAFLVGVGWWEGDRFSVSQLLLPDHAGEQALLDVLTAMLPEDAWLVSYNGRCFDWPLIVARFRLHRRAPPALAGHLDLLPVARSLWKHRLGSARLAVVEEAVCAVRREADLPGALVPERYFEYLRTRRPELLRQVVEHNQQDIVSLGLIVALLATLASSGSSVDHPGDLLGLARAYRRRGRIDDALACTEAALFEADWDTPRVGIGQARRQLSAERARLLARLGRREEAYAAWLELAGRGGPGAGVAWLHVARHREHIQHDVSGAQAACREAAAVAERARQWGAPLPGVEHDLARRLPRLRRLAIRRRPPSRVTIDRAA